MTSANPAHTLYSFTGKIDGARPAGGLTTDPDGNLYGAACQQTESQNGTIFRLAPPGQTEKKWHFTALYVFTDPQLGVSPCGTLWRRADGALFGLAGGGGANGAGTAFELDPPANPAGAWTETTLHDFAFSRTDGASPGGSLIADAQGRLFGTTVQGGRGCKGDLGCGVVFMLTPPENGTGWTEQVIYFFNGQTGKAGFPSGELAMAGDGTLFGTTPNSVFSLSETKSGAWHYTALAISPALPYGLSTGVTLGADGTLYGVTDLGGINNTGTVYALTPPADGTAPWTSALIHQFGTFIGNRDGYNPTGPLSLDANGTLFGTSASGGRNGAGLVYRMDPPAKPGGNWQFRIVTALSPPSGHGPRSPAGPVLLRSGAAYLTTANGGKDMRGTIVSVTP